MSRVTIAACKHQRSKWLVCRALTDSYCFALRYITQAQHLTQDPSKRTPNNTANHKWFLLGPMVQNQRQVAGISPSSLAICPPAWPGLKHELQNPRVFLCWAVWSRCHPEWKWEDISVNISQATCQIRLIYNRTSSAYVQYLKVRTQINLCPSTMTPRTTSKNGPQLAGPYLFSINQ